MPDHARRAPRSRWQIPDTTVPTSRWPLVRNGLVVASRDAPRSYADAEDDARGRKQSLWGRVNCSRIQAEMHTMTAWIVETTTLRTMGRKIATECRGCGDGPRGGDRLYHRRRWRTLESDDGHRPWARGRRHDGWPGLRVGGAASLAARWWARWPATLSVARSTSRSATPSPRRRKAPSWPTPTRRRPIRSSRRRPRRRRPRWSPHDRRAPEHPRRRQHLPADRTHGHQERPDDDRDDDLLQGLRFIRSEAGFCLITADGRRGLDLAGRCPAEERVAASQVGRGV